MNENYTVGRDVFVSINRSLFIAFSNQHCNNNHSSPHPSPSPASTLHACPPEPMTWFNTTPWMSCVIDYIQSINRQIYLRVIAENYNALNVSTGNICATTMRTGGDRLHPQLLSWGPICYQSPPQLLAVVSCKNAVLCFVTYAMMKVVHEPMYLNN